jgi:hypothetical protein
MQSRDSTDLPYWPSQNMYVYKEVWVHSTSRWLWLMEDLIPPAPRVTNTDGFQVTDVITRGGEVTIRAVVRGRHAGTFTLRSENLVVDRPTVTVTQTGNGEIPWEWKGRLVDPAASWVAVVIPDGDVSRRREVYAPGRR